MRLSAVSALSLAFCVLQIICGVGGIPLGDSWRDPDADVVASLPGWDGPLPSRWFSGFIPVALEGVQAINSHYIYVEREPVPGAEQGPAPILLWSNGGPGASSMFGLLTELGPFMLSDESLATEAFKKTGIPSLIRNPRAVTRVADLLVFDAPPPVGFSWCAPAGPAGDGLSCGNWTDERTAEVLLMPLRGALHIVGGSLSPHSSSRSPAACLNRTNAGARRLSHTHTHSLSPSLLPIPLRKKPTTPMPPAPPCRSTSAR